MGRRPDRAELGQGRGGQGKPGPDKVDLRLAGVVVTAVVRRIDEKKDLMAATVLLARLAGRGVDRTVSPVEGRAECAAKSRLAGRSFAAKRSMFDVIWRAEG